MALLRPMLMRRFGSVGMVLTAIDIWRRIPREHRRRIIAEARRHGPRLAKAAVKRGRGR